MTILVERVCVLRDTLEKVPLGGMLSTNLDKILLGTSKDSFVIILVSCVPQFCFLLVFSQKNSVSFLTYRTGPRKREREKGRGTIL